MPEIVTNNDFLIGSDGQGVGPPLLPMRITTREQAFRTAAWIEIMGETLPSEHDDDAPTYEQVREAILNT